MEISYAGVTVETCRGVYAPAEDTFLVVDNAMVGSALLEVGSGSGFTSIYYAKMGKAVSACDISEAAVECTLENARRNSVSINAFRSDLFSAVRGKYDTIIFNPPYLPSDDDLEEAIQWNGGSDGFAVVRPFLDAAFGFLRRDGKIYIVLSSLTDYKSLEQEYGNYTFSIVASQSFFFETIFLFLLTSKP
ncbi:putative S-adenosylmethionine-dependent methyltransferase [Thermoplasmatales archaeon]|nr:putative S-adenosylmethionine-dependent methyltransferase [Thermoplasmatales archaeon]